MRVEVIDIKENFQQMLKDFSAKLYPQHPFPNLQCNETIAEKFDKGFVLFLDDEPAAMACVIYNSGLLFEDKKTACIAFYECTENQELSFILLQAISDYCKLQGFEHIIGPLNSSTWNSYRFATETITDSFLSESFHKGYYTNQFKQFGFKTIAEYITRIDTKLVLPKASTVLNENISFRNLEIENFEMEMRKVFSFCKEIFRNNFLYTPISEEAFLKKYNAIKSIINPEFVLIAEHEGEIVGLILALHDLYCHNEKRLIIKTLARKSGVKYVGLAQELTSRLLNIASKYDYKSILHAFMHERNASTNVSKKFSGQPFRTYKLFQKEL